MADQPQPVVAHQSPPLGKAQKPGANETHQLQSEQGNVKKQDWYKLFEKELAQPGGPQ